MRRNPLPGGRTILFVAAYVVAYVVTFIAPLPAHATNWVVLDSRSGARIEADAAGPVRENGDRLRLWHREIYAKPQVLDSGAFSFGTLTVLTEFQCIKRLAAPVRRTYIAPDGNELKTESFDGKEALPVAPDSVAEAVFLHACKPKTKKAVQPAAKPAAGIESTSPEKPAADKHGTARKTVAVKEEAAHPHADVHWTYAGKTGAAKWGKLSDKFAACGVGQRQSPIDIRDAIRVDLPPIVFSYKAVPLTIIDNGHTVQVNAAGAGSITVEGEDYELLQFHFHKPSEERINGKAYDMVVHLVHKAKDGRLAVVAVMLQGGKEQKTIRALWSNWPLEQNKPTVKSDVSIDPSQLLPKNRSYYTFTGSLTTPPCSEGVLWLVLKTPTELSREQIADFGKLYNDNARPVQPRNARVIKGSAQ
ncbi:MAG: carbonic anhydrase family protein [Betaproteobacteria bacterium]|nr:carbonic anhydrase family protein [Betaproteobacteria bacterium]